MSNVSRILVVTSLRRLALAAGVVALLCACGQKGRLYLPTGTAAEGRMSLPDTLNPSLARPGPVDAPSPLPLPKAIDETGTANPIRTP